MKVVYVLIKSQAAEHVLGSVLCAPGCFSMYRCLTLKKILPKYASNVERAFDFLMKDMGEDRWLCTLMVQVFFITKSSCILYVVFPFLFKLKPDKYIYLPFIFSITFTLVITRQPSDTDWVENRLLCRIRERNLLSREIRRILQTKTPLDSFDFS